MSTTGNPRPSQPTVPHSLSLPSHRPSLLCDFTQKGPRCFSIQIPTYGTYYGSRPPEHPPHMEDSPGSSWLREVPTLVLEDSAKSPPKLIISTRTISHGRELSRHSVLPANSWELSPQMSFSSSVPHGDYSTSM
jgi:hypothetical protein